MAYLAGKNERKGKPVGPLLGVTFRQYCASVWPAAIAVCFMYGAVDVSRIALEHAGEPSVLRLAVNVAVGAGAYMVALWVVHQALF